MVSEQGDGVGVEAALAQKGDGSAFLLEATYLRREFAVEVAEDLLGGGAIGAAFLLEDGGDVGEAHAQLD